MSTSRDLKIRITAQDQASPALGKTKAGIESISRQLDSMRSSALAAFGVWTSASSVRDLANLADSVQGLNSRLLIAVGSAEAFSAAQARGYEISSKTGAGYEATATLLARLSQVGQGYGLTQEQIATTTQVAARSLQLSGAAAAESSAVIRQLSQALGSGVLRGEEFNSVMENGPRLAKALADGLGLPIGKLRGLAEQGLLTTDVVVAALESQAGVLEAEAANYQRTMGQAATRVTDEFGRMVDAANQWTGAGQSVVATFDFVADHMREMLGGVAVAAVSGLTLAMVKGGTAAVAWAAQTIPAQNAAAASSIALHRATVAEAEAAVAAATAHRAAVKDYWAQVAADVALQRAKTNLTTATSALAAAQTSASVVSRGLSMVVTALGGPIGIITTLLTAGATAWMIWGDKAENAANKAKTAAEEAEQAIRRMRTAQAFGEDALSPFRQDIAQAETMLAEARKVRSGYSVNPSGDVEFFTYVDDKAVAAAEAKVSAAYARLHEAARIQRKKVESEQTKSLAPAFNIMGQSFDTWLDKFRDRIDPVGGALKELAAKAKEAGIAVDSQQYKDAEALVRKAYAKKSTAAGKSLDLDDYGASALAAMQAQSRRELDILKAKLAGELSLAQRGFEAGTTSLETYYAERRRVIETESAAEIAVQEKAIAKAQAEQARLRQMSPGGTRGQEQISDQLRALGPAGDPVRLLRRRGRLLAARGRPGDRGERRRRRDARVLDHLARDPRGCDPRWCDRVPLLGPRDRRGDPRGRRDRVRGAPSVQGQPRDHDGRDPPRVRQGRGHLHEGLAARARDAGSARGLRADRRGLRPRRGPARGLPRRCDRRGCAHGRVPRELGRHVGQREEDRRGRPLRREELPRARGRRDR